ncbi:cyclic AMP-responsive element-binding protein 3-like protein 3 isoform X1 [Hydra vulgaris]|uniref:cyclic AMP-responsive element-binding protein 3-like protein 3 isoform X1 n=1 Tax=Hydra vulgaris TaxID=6087 RepID=UPI001F5EF111|nr:cyclic AMP-responsive element-binding protein 3-like protein 3 [Hydra vulgaris]
MLSDAPFDYFDNLFEDYLSEKPDMKSFSIGQSVFPLTHVHSEDDFSDSGHGSPGSCVSTRLSNSPDPISNWESNIERSIWGSILDDLPDEILSTEIDNHLNNFQNASRHENDIVLENVINSLDDESCLLTMCTKEILNNIETDENYDTKSQEKISPTSNDFNLSISNESDEVEKSVQLLPFLQNFLQNSSIKVGENVFFIQKNQVATSTPSASHYSDIAVQQVNISTPTVFSQKFSLQNLAGLSKTSTLNDKQNEILTSVSKIKNAKQPNNIEDHNYFNGVARDAIGTNSEKQESMLKLTDEEKRLLELENVVLPENFGLTKDEEKILKKVRRKIKNKQSAMESRRRRKEYIDSLEQRVKNCTDINLTLKKKVDSLTDENKSLLKQLKELQKFFSTSVQQSHNTKKGTCFAVLALTFGLLFLPFNSMSGNILKSSTEVPNQANVFRSRTLLHLKKQNNYEAFENDAVLPHSDIYNRTYLTSDFKVFSEEMRNKIEQLLTEDSGSNLLKTTLDVYMNSIKLSRNWELKKLDPINVLEFHQDDVSSY